MAETTTRKTMPLEIKVLAPRTFETIASTGSLDRERDNIPPTAWELETYRATGQPILWAHRHDLPPIARSLDVRVVGNTLRTVDLFPERGVYDLADQVHDLVKGGFITAKSVGFRPLAWEPNAEGGKTYTRVSLIEHSYCAVGANQEALVVARSKGVRDRAALDAFFRMPRAEEEEERVLVVREGDADDLVSFEPRDLALAIREVMEQRVRAEVRRQTRHWPGLAPSVPVLLVEDASGAVREVTVDDIRAATTAALQTYVSHEVGAAVRRLTGRID